MMRRKGVGVRDVHTPGFKSDGLVCLPPHAWSVSSVVVEEYSTTLRACRMEVLGIGRRNRERKFVHRRGV